MKNTQFKVENTFGDKIGGNSISSEQIIRRYKFGQKNVYNFFCIKIKQFYGKKKNNIDIQPSFPPDYDF